MLMMKEQLEISVKQYTEKMNILIKEQARQIQSLQRHLVSNQKNIVEVQSRGFAH
jgi:hypothetical protein